MTTPDGREGWSDIFLGYGHPAFLVDQPRRGEAGNTAAMTADGFLDTWSADSVEKNLPAELARYGRTVLLAYGGGSIKKNGVYDE